MEDIRQYLDTTHGYHKGETHSAAVFAGLVLLATGVFWVLNGGYFLIFFSSSFEAAAGGLAIGAPSSLQCWLMGAFRLAMGLALCWMGLRAWDSRRGFLYWAWAVIPTYLYFWGSYFLALDPEFRATRLAPGNLFVYPAAFLVLGSMLLLLLVLPICTLAGYAFKSSAEDTMPVVVIAIVAVLWFGCRTYVAEIDPVAVNTAVVYGLQPLDRPESGIPTLKLVALSHEALRCHDNMDQLKEGMERLIATGASVKFSAYDTRPGGERLVRRLQQSAGVPVPLECPGGGWYRLDGEKGTWHCSEHGDRLPPSERRVGGGEEQEEDPDLQPGL